jgi:hypothetical protein
MSSDDVHPYEMPDPLDAFLDELRHAAAGTPAPEVGDALRTLFQEGAAPVLTAPAGRRRSGRMRVAVAGAVAGLTFGGLGVAGALPGPVQSGVAEVADVVGVHLPDGHDDPTPTTTPEPTVPLTPAAPPHRSTSTGTPATADHHGGESDDDDRTTTTVEDHRGPGHGGEIDGDDDGPETTTTTEDRDDRSGPDDGTSAGSDDSGSGSGDSGSGSGSSGDGGSGSSGSDDNSGSGNNGSGSSGSGSSGSSGSGSGATTEEVRTDDSGSGRIPTTITDVDSTESDHSGHGSATKTEG